ncbi:kinase domain protein [Coprococcus sp. CAG:782]|nr:kinase domain protein [Coprococcus sp. CAG:782]
MQICLNCLNTYEEGVKVCPHCGLGNWKYQAAEKTLELGTMLKSRYKIGTVIGDGGFGITYRAVDMNTGKGVAVKEFYPREVVARSSMDHTTVKLVNRDNTAQFQKGLNSFLEEANGLARFNNTDKIVNVYDFFEQNGTAYIVMEYLRGKPLSRYAKDHGGKISVSAAINVIMKMCEALSYVHGAGMVHRDISPDNIFVEKTGKIKLIDFGAARESYGNEEKTLSIVLKPNYAPPEQFRKKSRQGPWTDVYALGATVYKLLTGRTPDQAIDRIMEDEMQVPSRYNPEVPLFLDRIVMKMMAPKIEDRFQNCDEVRREMLKHVTYNPNAALDYGRSRGGGASDTTSVTGNSYSTGQVSMNRSYQANSTGSRNYIGQNGMSGSRAYTGQNGMNGSRNYAVSNNVNGNRNYVGGNVRSRKKSKSRNIILGIVSFVVTAVLVFVIVTVIRNGGNNSGSSGSKKGTAGNTTSTTGADTEMASTEAPASTVDYGRYIYDEDGIFYVDPDIFYKSGSYVTGNADVTYEVDTSNPDNSKEYLAFIDHENFNCIDITEDSTGINEVMFVGDYSTGFKDKVYAALTEKYGEYPERIDSGYSWNTGKMIAYMLYDETDGYVSIFYSIS